MVAYAMCALTAITAFGPYRALQRDFGSPFVTNWGAAPFPDLFQKVNGFRPGIRSISDGLFTFRLIDLLQHPTLRRDDEWYPESRTSLWTLLYGRFHFSRYPSWPPSWETSSGWVRSLGRLSFLLALLPSAILALALWRRALRWLTLIRERTRRRGLSPPEALIDALAFGYLGFIVAYAVRHRDFPVMKEIFVLPAVLGFTALFAAELDSLSQGGGWRAVLARVTLASSVLLCVAYFSDVALLIAAVA